MINWNRHWYKNLKWLLPSFQTVNHFSFAQSQTSQALIKFIENTQTSTTSNKIYQRHHEVYFDSAFIWYCRCLYIWSINLVKVRQVWLRTKVKQLIIWNEESTVKEKNIKSDCSVNVWWFFKELTMTMYSSNKQGALFPSKVGVG